MIWVLLSKSLYVNAYTRVSCLGELPLVQVQVPCLLGAGRAGNASAQRHLGVRAVFRRAVNKPGRDSLFHHIYKGLGFFVDWRIKQH